MNNAILKGLSNEALTIITESNGYSNELREAAREILEERNDKEAKKKDITGNNEINGGTTKKDEPKMLVKRPNGGFMDAWFLGVLVFVLEPLLIFIVYNLFK